MKNLVITLALMVGVTGMAQAKGDAAAGQTKAAVCAACHGPDGNSPVDMYPKIAGQHADYLFVALKSYKADARNANVGRNNAIMGGIAKQFSNAELKALANYLASVEGDLQVVPQSRFR